MLFKVLMKRPDEVNKKSADMWSFAVILWELYTRDIPFCDYTPMQCGLKVAYFILINKFFLFAYEFAEFFKILRENLRLELPVGMTTQMQKLIRICMNEEPTKRPKFDMILPILEKLKK